MMELDRIKVKDLKRQLDDLGQMMDGFDDHADIYLDIDNDRDDRENAKRQLEDICGALEEMCEDVVRFLS